MTNAPMCKIKVVFVVGGPLTDRWLNYYCLDDISKVFDVEFWNLSGIVEFPYKPSSVLERDYCITINSMQSLRLNSQRLPKDSLVVMELGQQPHNYDIYQEISLYIKNCIVIDFWTYSLPIALQQINLRRHKIEKESIPIKFKRLLYKSDVLMLAMKFLRHGSGDKFKSAYMQWRNKKHCKVVRETRNCHDLFTWYEISYQSTSRYAYNLPDYDKYLKIRDSSKMRSDRYVVYIDQYFPLHPENAIMEPTIDFVAFSKPFYKSINHFFDKLEAQYNCKVVIAGHPTAKYDINPFDNREIIFYKTAELVKDSIAVCMHYSNSFSFVAFFNKPLAIISCMAMSQSPRTKQCTEQFAAALNSKLYDMDTVADVSNIFKPIDNEVREKYLSIFAKGDNKLNTELLKEDFKSIHNDIISKLK